MSEASYYLHYDNSGKTFGTGFTPDGTFPAETIACSQSQAENFQCWGVAGGALVAVTPPTPTLAQQAQAAISAGFAVTSTSTPALNGTYACDDAHQARINRVQGFIAANGKFPNGLTSLPWPDITGAVHEFSSTAEFTAFASAVADYVMALDAVIMGISTTLPPAKATIP